jgi:transcriptional regulator with XRE-family HTH domain
MDVAMHAGFSARHISFIETGKAHPSRDALLAIAESLEVPLRERNRLLSAGGFADLYRETRLADADMAQVRHVLQFILDRHMPYGALVLDRLSTCLMGNDASARLLSQLADPGLLTPNANMLRVVFHPLGVRRFIVNWAEVSRALLDRAERELAAAQDPAAIGLLNEIRGYAADIPKPQPRRLQSSDVLLPVQIRTGAFELKMFSTIMTIGTPQDITLQELRIETFFPADDASEQTWRRLAAS